jgi:hypothetical protein
MSSSCGNEAGRRAIAVAAGAREGLGANAWAEEPSEAVVNSSLPNMRGFLPLLCRLEERDATAPEETETWGQET